MLAAAATRDEDEEGINAEFISEVDKDAGVEDEGGAGCSKLGWEDNEDVDDKEDEEDMDEVLEGGAVTPIEDCCCCC